MTDVTKFKAIAMLTQDREKTEFIAKELDISHSKVLRWRTELEIATVEGNVSKLLSMDEAAVTIMAEDMVKSLPEELQPPAAIELEELSSSLAGLAILDIKMQASATTLVNRITTMSSTIEHVGELEDLSSALCKLRDSFFNNKAVQVNVQNNYGEEESYKEFLGDGPGA